MNNIYRFLTGIYSDRIHYLRIDSNYGEKIEVGDIQENNLKA